MVFSNLGLRLCLLLFLLVETSLLSAQITPIPNANFEAKLIQLGIDSDSTINGRILTSDAAGISSLDISNSIIDDITGIVAFVDLDTLICSSNYALFRIPANTPTRLKYLNIQYCNLYNLDLSAFPNLETLLCGGNQFLRNLQLPSSIKHLECTNIDTTSLDLMVIPNLETLDCQYNDFTSFDPSLVPQLRVVNLSNNLIDSIDFSNHTNIEAIYISSGLLNSLNISQTPNLEVLYCNNNQVAGLDVTTSPSLRVLLAYSNINLGDLDFSNSPQIEVIRSSGCGISNLTLQQNLQLTDLFCQGNNISSLDVNQAPNLVNFTAGFNQLTNVAFSDHPFLEDVNIINNQLSTLEVTGAPNLKRLFAYDNQLTSINLSQNSALELLSIGINDLEDLDVSNSTTLYTLDANNNPIYSINLTSNPNLGYLNMANTRIGELDVSNKPNLFQLNATSCLLRNLTTKNCPILRSLRANNNLPGLQICIDSLGYALYQQLDGYYVKDQTAFFTETCLPIAAVGQVAIDTNNNCLVDSAEVGIVGTLVQFTSPTATYYGVVVDTMGNYFAYLDTGTYTVAVVPPGPYWQGCPGQQTITIDTSGTVQQVDFALQAPISCPYLVVDLGAPFIRRTIDSLRFSSYTVHYENTGTLAANNAYIEIDLDSFLILGSSTWPIASQVGSVYRFNIGQIDIAEKGSFSFTIGADTTAAFGQTHCTSAHIFPDSICTTINWAGANLVLEGQCRNDSVLFTLENVGAAMGQSLDYFIFEDNIMMAQSNFQLGAGGIQRIAQVASPGKSYRILTQQEPGYPSLLGDSILVATVEGCVPNPDGSFTFNTVSELYNNSSLSAIDIDCQNNIGSFDPNDKQAQPTGFDPNFHYIFPFNPLDYKIRFQNTGTDTAFSVVILDTLSPYLDLSSIRLGASSHPYTWTLNGNILEVRFPGIELVDSTTNEPLSHGFFNYYIEQTPNNPDGSVIYNRAAIYFDYNPPIITNQTFHTVGRNFLPVFTKVPDITVETVHYYIAPNPMNQQGTLHVEGENLNQLRVEIFDAMGRMVQQLSATNSNQITLERGDLPAGFYSFRLYNADSPIGVGKLIVQ